MKHAKCYKKGYPRPRFVREKFTSLDGEWDFAFDDENAGERKKWHKLGVNDLKINVPFAYQCALSGINVEDLHKTVWYSRTFTAEKKRNKRLLINFEGADHEAKVLTANFSALTPAATPASRSILPTTSKTAKICSS